MAEGHPQTERRGMMKKRLCRIVAAIATAFTCLAGSAMPAMAAPQQMEDGTMFDAEYYAQSNPDVVAVLGNSPQMMWAHYKTSGKAEGRLPYAGAPTGNNNNSNSGAGSLAALAGKTGCILVDKNTVGLSLALTSLPASDDGVLYVVKMGPFESVPSTGAIATVALQANPQATFALDASSGLYSKYAFCVKQGGAIKVLGTPQYITNPEVLATATKPFRALPSKSTQDEMKTFWNYWMDLPAGRNGAGANTQMLQVLNSGNDAALLHPYARVADSHPIPDKTGYYMLNASDWNGVMTMATRLHNVAAVTNTQDFVIGNEVNERKWNYVAYMNDDQYIREYMQGFRVCYNAIKSANANARVFISIDQRWDCNYPTSNPEHYHFIDGKDFLEKFNSMISAEGNIDWCVAAHPHLVPLTWSRFWNYNGLAGGSIYQGLVTSGKFMSFQNASMLTNYLQQPALLSPSGKVRTVVYSEITLAAAPDEASQAAALYASYYATVTNPYVEAIIYAQDPSTGAYFGAQTKSIYAMMGTDQNAAADAYAKGVIGISNWSQVIH